MGAKALAANFNQRTIRYLLTSELAIELKLDTNSDNYATALQKHHSQARLGNNLYQAFNGVSTLAS